ncbi:MAG: hypothetical protein J0H68_02495 [Sphingobacteriia bacterium]|nr:hypothetical protein [Sphingobacteriia bacterium]
MQSKYDNEIIEKCRNIILTISNSEALTNLCAKAFKRMFDERREDEKIGYARTEIEFYYKKFIKIEKLEEKESLGLFIFAMMNSLKIEAKGFSRSDNIKESFSGMLKNGFQRFMFIMHIGLKNQINVLKISSSQAIALRDFLQNAQNQDIIKALSSLMQSLDNIKNNSNVTLQMQFAIQISSMRELLEEKEESDKKARSPRRE